MTFPFAISLAAALGYLAGAIPFGYIVGRACGVNILEEGSRNPGATNVMRVVGKRAGISVFLLDFLKGAAAAGWPLFLPLEANTILIVSIVGLCAAIFGHSFSVFLKGRGGKGVATTIGGLLVIMPVAVMIGLLVWVIVFFASRYVSLASILFAASLPVSTFLWGSPALLRYVSLGLAILIVVRHISNIQRLLNGTENRFVRPKGGE